MLFHIKILPLSLVIPTENLIYRNSIVRLPCEFLTYPPIVYTGLVSLYFKNKIYTSCYLYLFLYTNFYHEIFLF